MKCWMGRDTQLPHVTTCITFLRNNECHRGWSGMGMMVCGDGWGWRPIPDTVQLSSLECLRFDDHSRPLLTADNRPCLVGEPARRNPVAVAGSAEHSLSRGGALSRRLGQYIWQMPDGRARTRWSTEIRREISTSVAVCAHVWDLLDDRANVYSLYDSAQVFVPKVA